MSEVSCVEGDHLDAKDRIPLELPTLNPDEDEGTCPSLKAGCLLTLEVGTIRDAG